MMIVGLTGGIGSGKTTVAGYFKALNIPVYHADDEAKRLMHDDAALRDAIQQAFGKQAYIKGVLQRQYIADIVFADPEQLAVLNALVHPAVGRDFKKWCQKQEAPYVIQENALIFETGSADKYDAIIAVIVPKEIRIKRVKLRDGVTRKKVLARMAQQCGDRERRSISNFIIHNTLAEKAKEEVKIIHKKICEEQGLNS